LEVHINSFLELVKNMSSYALFPSGLIDFVTKNNKMASGIIKNDYNIE